MKKILILNGSFCEQPIIIKAKEMGYYVVTTGNAPELVGHQFADEYIPEDYSNKEAILKLVKDNGIEGIVSCANDFGVITSAYVAEQMGWKGHDTYENALILHHKDKFKKYCAQKNLPSPLSVVFDDENVCMEYVKNCEFPIIVKANDLTGGKGIMKAYNQEEAEMAVKNAFERSREKHIVVEPFIEGTQHTIITFVYQGKVMASTSCNCYSPINPYLIQSETFPAEGIELVQEQLHGVIEGIVADLHLADGIFALQYMMKDGKPYIIEMMRRIFGNQLTTILEANTGFPWEEAYIRVALGMNLDGLEKREPLYPFCGHHGIMKTENGMVNSVTIPDKIQKHIFKRIDMLESGDKIDDYLNQRVAYIYYHYDSLEEINSAVRTFNNDIVIG